MTSHQEPELAFLPLGANLHTFTVGGLPLVLSLPSTQAYVSTTNPNFFGETIGRVANRVSGASLSLNGTTYKLPANEGANTLHGGPTGWGKASWSGPHPEQRRGAHAVRFTLRSPDGDAGFPGALITHAWYIASTEGGVTSLEVEYEVSWDEAGPKTGQHGEQLTETVVNVTNHTAFTVAPVAPSGQSRNIAGTKAVLFTDRRQEVDDKAIPTGRITTHPGITVGKEFVLERSSPAFDDCFVIAPAGTESAIPLDTRASELRKLCAFSHPETNVHLEAWSTEPAFQFYTGEFIGLEYKDETGATHKFDKRAGFCVEASRFVDAPRYEEWRGQVLLKRGEVWGSRTVYKAWKQ